MYNANYTKETNRQSYLIVLLIYHMTQRNFNPDMPATLLYHQVCPADVAL